MTSEIEKIATTLLKEILTEAQNQWLEPNSKYREYRNLQIDKRGSFGERLVSQLLTLAFKRRIQIEYKDGDQGDWDIKFNNLKIEVKTSSIDTNNKFQNEGIKKDGDYDAIFFLGIKPNQIFFKFILKKDIKFSKLHNRTKRKTGCGYKWDLKESEMIELKNIDNFKDEFTKKVKDKI